MNSFFIYLLSAAIATSLNPRDFDHVVVIPDIHGDSESLVRTIWMLAKELNHTLLTSEVQVDEFEPFNTLITTEAEQVKIGSPITHPAHFRRTAIVQLGDVFDRGPYGMLCVQILESLPRLFGWQVIRLYGNHELLNYLGLADQFIHPREDHNYGIQFKHLVERFGIMDDIGHHIRSGLFRGPLWKSISRKSVLMARLLDPTSVEPRSVLPVTSPSALFVHGGIDMNYLRSHFGNATSITDVDDMIHQINREVKKLLSQPHNGESESVLNLMDSPLWTRDLADVGSDYVCSRLLPTVLRKFQVARIIVGHTPQMDKRMKSLCGSRLILADAAMSKWMHKNSWAIDEKNEEEEDQDGFPIEGNPSFLIMKLNSTNQQLDSMNAFYYDVNSDYIEIVDLLITPHVGKSGLDEFTVSTLAAPFSGPSRDVVQVAEFSLAVITYKVDPRSEVLPVLRKLKNSSPIPSIPEILRIGPNIIPTDPSSWYAVFKVSGVPARVHFAQFPFVSHMFRQVIECVIDLFQAGIFFDYKVATTRGEALLEYFLVESNTQIMKLINYKPCRLRSATDRVESSIAEIVVDLTRIGRARNLAVKVLQILIDLDYEFDFEFLRTVTTSVYERLTAQRRPAPSTAELEMMYSPDWSALNSVVAYMDKTGMVRNKILIKDESQLDRLVDFVEHFNEAVAAGDLMNFNPLRLYIVPEGADQVAYIILYVGSSPAPLSYRHMQSLGQIVQGRQPVPLTLGQMVLDKVKRLHNADICLMVDSHINETIVMNQFMYSSLVNNLAVVDYSTADICTDDAIKSTETHSFQSIIPRIFDRGEISSHSGPVRPVANRAGDMIRPKAIRPTTPASFGNGL